ncbi:MAG: hypothetical protein ACRDTM_16560, partial [Micromonosporaceae bacterium]
GLGWDGAAPARPAYGSPVSGTETGAFHRIEKLERELVELRSVLGGVPANGQRPAAAAPPGVRAPQPVAPRIAAPAAGYATPPARPPGAVREPDPTKIAPPQMAANGGVRGVATVPVKEPDPTSQAAPVRPPPGDQRRPPPELSIVLKRGSEITGVGVLFAFVCWGIWSVANPRDGFLDRFLIFLFVLVIGAGVFVLARLVGRFLWERLMGRVRRNARGAHTLTAAYLAAAGLGFLGQTPWVVDLWAWLKTLV